MKWVIGAILLLVLAWPLHLGLLVYASYVILGLVTISRLLTAAWTRQLIAERIGSDSAREIGQTVQVSVTVRNRGPFRIPWLLLEDSVPLAASPEGQRRLARPRAARERRE